MRPLAAPQGTPHPFAVPSATKAFWIPPAIIEDPDAPPVEEGEGVSVSGIIRSLIPGISLYDAYQSWKAGDDRGLARSAGFGTLDVLSLGSFSRTRGLLAFVGGVVKSRVKAEVVDAVAGEAGNVVGDRFGVEAGLLTEMVVSGVLSGKHDSQDQKVLGFAANGGAKKLADNINKRQVIVHGKPQVTSPGHAQKIFEKATEMANSERYKAIYMHKKWSTILEGTGVKVSPNLLPDIAGIRRNGKIDIVEIASKTDNLSKLLKRNKAVWDQLPENLRGRIIIINQLGDVTTVFP